MAAARAAPHLPHVHPLLAPPAAASAASSAQPMNSSAWMDHAASALRGPSAPWDRHSALAVRRAASRSVMASGAQPALPASSRAATEPLRLALHAHRARCRLLQGRCRATHAPMASFRVRRGRLRATAAPRVAFAVVPTPTHAVAAGRRAPPGGTTQILAAAWRTRAGRAHQEPATH